MSDTETTSLVGNIGLQDIDEEYKTKVVSEILNKKNWEESKPSDLYTMRRALAHGKNGTIADGNKKAQETLDLNILALAKDFNNNKNAVLNMEEVYSLQALLDNVSQYDRSEIMAKDENKNVINDAISKINKQIEAFEHEYGINNESLQSVEQIVENTEKMPKVEDLLDKKNAEYVVQPPTSYEDVRLVVQNISKITEASPIVGALRCEGVRQEKDVLQKLQEKTLEIVKNDALWEDVSPENIGNLEYLLEEAASISNIDDEAKKIINKRRDLIAEAKRKHEKNLPRKHSELTDGLNLLDNIEILGELETFGRKTLSEDEQKQIKDNFIKQIRLETEVYLANTSDKEISDKDFVQEFSNRLNTGLFELVSANGASRGELSQEKINERITALLKGAQNKDKSIKINMSTFAGWHAAKQASLEAAYNVTEKKRPGYKEKISSLVEKTKTQDESNKQTHGTAYSLAKGALKSLGWGAAYKVGAIAGPAGLAAVATASTAWQAYNMYKDFRKQQEHAQSKGEKLGFWGYLKDNKLRAAGVLLSSASIVTGGFLAGNSAANTAKAASGIALAAAGAFHQASQAYKAAEGSKWAKFKAGARAFGVSATAFGVAVLAGKTLGGIAGNESVDTPTTESTTEPMTEEFNESQTQTFGEQADKAMNDYYTENKAHQDTDLPTQSAGEQAAEAMYEYYEPNKTFDMNDLTDSQVHKLEIMMLRDPAMANEVIGDGKWHSSAELQKMWEQEDAIDNEIRQKLVKAADKTFDNNGRYVDTGREEEAQANWQRLNEPEKENIPQQPENIVEHEKLEGVLTNKNIDLQFEKPTLDLTDENRPEATPNMEINKIKIDGDEAKIVGENANGERVVNHISTNELGSLDLDYNKIKLMENGDIKIRIDVDVEGKPVEVESVINKEGELVSHRSGSHVYSKEELDYVNSQEQTVARNADRYEKLMTIMDRTSERVSENQVEQSAENQAIEHASQAEEKASIANEKDTPTAQEQENTSPHAAFKEMADKIAPIDMSDAEKLQNNQVIIEQDQFGNNHYVGKDADGNSFRVAVLSKGGELEGGKMMRFIGTNVLLEVSEGHPKHEMLNSQDSSTFIERGAYPDKFAEQLLSDIKENKYDVVKSESAQNNQQLSIAQQVMNSRTTGR
ncbi:MAG: hypothetical protein E7018_05715 [Alphaproteobacteria bacterium]|nr:hypothetical protein [Alphaproteobacteria bacterium]